jgi:hypothetical protein
MYPGRARIIETPSSSAEGDLLREIGRALGTPCSPIPLWFSQTEFCEEPGFFKKTGPGSEVFSFSRKADIGSAKSGQLFGKHSMHGNS